MYQKALPAYDRFLKATFGDMSANEHNRLQRSLESLRNNAEK